MLPMRIFVAVLAIMLVGTAWAAAADEEEKPWIEAEVALPAYPADADLIEFYVSAATSSRFFIDGKSLSIGSDGVVRFSLVVLTSGGATNVSHEGIRCSAREVRLYATGRSDRTWSPSRLSAWKPIENKAINRQHAALSSDFFCPNRIPIRNADEGRRALKRGIHPDVEQTSEPN